MIEGWQPAEPRPAPPSLDVSHEARDIAPLPLAEWTGEPAWPLQSAAPAELIAASVLVRRASGGHGSGVVVGHSASGRLVVLTNRHVAEGERDFWIHSARGHKARGRLLALAPVGDLAGVELLEDLPGAVVAKVSTQPLVAGEQCWQVGFGGGQLHERRGAYRRPGQRREWGVWQTSEFSIHVIRGDSGSGVYRVSDRALVALTWGGPQLSAVSLKPIRDFLERLCNGRSPSPGPQPPDLAPILADVAALKAAVAALATRPSRGERGETGLQGVPGPPGPIGAMPDLGPLRSETARVHTEAKAGLDLLAERVGSRLAPLDGLAGKSGQVLGAVETVGTWARWLPWIAGGAASGGIVPIALLGLKLFGAYRRLKKQAAGGSSGGPVSSPAPERPAPPAAPPMHSDVMVVQGKPPPQVVHTVTDHVLVEKPNGELKAYKDAMAALAQKRPEMLGVIETIHSFAKQIHSGQPVTA